VGVQNFSQGVFVEVEAQLLVDDHLDRDGAAHGLGRRGGDGLVVSVGVQAVAVLEQCVQGLQRRSDVVELGLPPTRLAQSLPVFWQFARRVEDPKNLDAVQARHDPVRYDVTRIGDHQFTSAVNAPWMSQRRVFRQQAYRRVMNALNHHLRSSRIVVRDIRCFDVEVLQGLAEPPNLHRLPTFSILS
jgi:hypothetical protein